MAAFNKKEAQAFLDLLEHCPAAFQLNGGGSSMEVLLKMEEEAKQTLNVNERVFGSASDVIEVNED